MLLPLGPGLRRRASALASVLIQILGGGHIFARIAGETFLVELDNAWAIAAFEALGKQEHFDRFLP